MSWSLHSYYKVVYQKFGTEDEVKNNPFQQNNSTLMLTAKCIRECKVLVTPPPPPPTGNLSYFSFFTETYQRPKTCRFSQKHGHKDYQNWKHFLINLCKIVTKFPLSFLQKYVLADVSSNFFLDYFKISSKFVYNFHEGSVLQNLKNPPLNKFVAF